MGKALGLIPRTTKEGEREKDDDDGGGEPTITQIILQKARISVNNNKLNSEKANTMIQLMWNIQNGEIYRLKVNEIDQVLRKEIVFV